MVDTPAVPGGPGEITPSWLTDALRTGGELPHGAVSAVSVETIGADRGFTGVIARRAGSGGWRPPSLTSCRPGSGHCSTRRSVTAG